MMGHRAERMGSEHHTRHAGRVFRWSHHQNPNPPESESRDPGPKPPHPPCTESPSFGEQASWIPSKAQGPGGRDTCTGCAPVPACLHCGGAASCRRTLRDTTSAHPHKVRRSTRSTRRREGISPGTARRESEKAAAGAGSAMPAHATAATTRETMVMVHLLVLGIQPGKISGAEREKKNLEI